MVINEMYVRSIVNNAISLLWSTPETATLLSKLRVYDALTFQHCENVSYLAAMLLSDYEGYIVPDISEIAIAGMMHDIGKIKVDIAIIAKPGRLTPAEYRQVKLHVDYSAELLRDVPLSVRVKEGIVQHHERLDGSGYNRQLKGNEISPFGQILAVCDVFDALINKRAYKDALSFDKVAQIMRSDMGLNQTLVQRLLMLQVESYRGAV